MPKLPKNEIPDLDAAKIGKMYVTNVSFSWQEGESRYNDAKQDYEKLPGHWNISATLRDKPSRYADGQQMSISVEHGVGQKLAEILLPVIIADASAKAQQLADDSKAMLAALGDRTLRCITDMPQEPK